MNGDVVDTVVGLVLIVSALALVAGLVFWSRRTIRRIARRGFASAREIVRDESGDS